MSELEKKEPSTLNENAGPDVTKANHSIDQGNSKRKMPCSINKKLVGKVGQRDVAKHGHQFEAMELSAEELASYIQNNGYACNTVFKGQRKANNFVKAGFIMLDFDGGFALEAARNHPFIKAFASFIYTTPSHRKGSKGDRFRVVFEFARIISEAEEFKKLLRGLLKKFPQADQCCKDPTRIFFGSLDCELITLHQVLPNTMIDELIELDSKEKVTVDQGSKQTTRKDDPTLEQVREMLSYINPMPGYDIWRDLIWSTKSWGYLNNISDEVIKKLIEEWSPDYKTDGEEIDKLLDSYEHGRISIGTLVYHAQQGGYQPINPEGKKSTTTPGQVAMHDLFYETEKYAAFGENLYYFSDGYYQHIADDILRKRVADYFDVYITDPESGATSYASANTVDSAIKYVKARYYRNPESVNPSGVNLRNGYLRLIYDNEGKPKFELLKHSPEYFFTYKAEFDYDPEADSTVFDEAANNILDNKQQSILFRSLAATFDLEKIRIQQGRAVRVLLLYGEGSNGKDTIREWILKLYCSQGMSFIGLQAFRNADSGRLFGLLNLVTSKINWSSENKAISLDQCQSLKNCATGDPIELEEKFKQGFAIKPKSVMIFNINQIPRIEAQQEAISSRYGILHFKNIFKSKPNEDNPREIKADPRLKEDHRYIMENIMPAFLNRLITEFHNVLRDGVDYSCNNKLMQEIREDNDHFIEFVNHTGLIECDIKEGLNATQIFTIYEKYCKNLGLIEDDNQSGLKKYNDPSKYDRIVRDVRQITIRLKEVFSGLQVLKSGSKGRRIGLNFLIDEDDL